MGQSETINVYAGSVKFIVAVVGRLPTRAVKNTSIPVPSSFANRVPFLYVGSIVLAP